MSRYALPGLFPPLPIGMMSGVGKSPSSAALADDGNKESQPKEDKIQLTESSCPIWIAVKEARIDSMRLVQALLTSPKKQSGTTQKQSTRTRNRKGSNNRKRANSSQCSSPREDAMQFELSITFNGRKYTAVRSLLRILQLRQDLVNELEERRMMLWQDGSRSEDGTCHENTDPPVTIPELPKIEEESSTGKPEATGFVGRSFSLLHALLRSYSPALEGWLRSVTLIVSPSESPSLTQFLWEPLSPVVHELESGFGSVESLLPLDAIEESETEYEDEEEDDCCSENWI